MFLKLKNFILCFLNIHDLGGQIFNGIDIAHKCNRCGKIIRC